MFIVIVGVAMAGFFAAFNTITKGSIDPEVRKQALAIAESLMDEVALMPFTYCDPNDPNVATATSATVQTVPPDPTKCFTAAEVAALLPTDPSTAEPGETRYSATTPFDNVNDYHQFQMLSGIQDITNATISGLGSYQATITVTQAGLGVSPDAIPAAAALLISVTVTYVATDYSITLEGYRTRYAPTTAP
jgi:MSHA pilin protein MshD